MNIYRHLNRIMCIFLCLQSQQLKTIRAMPMIVLIGFAVLAASLVGCHDNDIGNPCPALTAAAEPQNEPAISSSLSSPERLETSEIVGQDLSYPCEELVCIASAGQPGYCSRKCIVDSPTGCPTGFECAVIQLSGEFADQGFCRWRSCKSVKDCGPNADFCCLAAPSTRSTPTRICTFKKGSCS